MALNLDEESIGVVLLGDGQRVKQDDRVRRTGRVMSVPVGEALIGRVVNALVASGAADPAALLYISPYATTAMGEYFRDAGRHALCIYDDLSRHAQAYRWTARKIGRASCRERV